MKEFTIALAFKRWRLKRKLHRAVDESSKRMSNMSKEERQALGDKARQLMSECCSDWKPNSEILDSLCVMDSIHGGKGYHGKLFVYCPWCGKKKSNRVTDSGKSWKS